MTVTSLVLAFSSPVALDRLIDRLTLDPLADARLAFSAQTYEAMRANLPFGTGLGTFIPVYAEREALDTAYGVYANRAHNDFLEFWLETGVAGLVIAALCAAWFARAGWHAWRANNRQVSAIDIALRRSAVIALTLLLIHSAVDYPLRTTALMVVAAYFCGLLAAPAASAPERPAAS